MKSLLICCIVLFILCTGCDKGLAPIVVSPGFSGTITYKSKFPPPDSLLDLRIIAVPYYPIDSSFQKIYDKVTSLVIAFSPEPLSTVTPTIKYTMFVDPKTYYYVAVVQQYGDYTQWRVVGIYCDSTVSNIPKSVTVSDGKYTEGIDINVDFYNLPPQPFK